MSNDPSATLECFFALPEDLIKRDLERIRGNLEAFHEEAKALRSVDYRMRSAAVEAQLHHLMMVQAYELCRLSHVAPEFKIFYAGFGAGHVTQDAEMIAHDKGKLAELSKRMDEIRQREGLSTDQFWYRGEGPDEYEALEDEYSAVSGRIADTVFIHTLRRYRLDKPADLYEDDPMEFDIQREIGRRLLFPAQDDRVDVERMMDDSMLKRFGPEIFSRIQRRVDELKKNKG